MSVSVKGKILSSVPCTLKESAKFLTRFLNSDVLPEEGLLRGYLTSVASAIEEGVTRHNLNNERKEAYEQSEFVNHESKVSNVKVEVKDEPLVNGGSKSNSSTFKRKLRDVDGNDHKGDSSRKSKKKLKIRKKEH